MNNLRRLLTENNLEVVTIGKRYIGVKYDRFTINVDSYALFSMEDDDALLYVKQEFYKRNIKINIKKTKDVVIVPDNTVVNDMSKKKKKKKKKKGSVVVYRSTNYINHKEIKKKKEKIRELLTYKYKLIPEDGI